MKNNEDQSLRKMGLIWVVISDIVGFTLAGVGLGYLLWGKLHWSVWVMILFPMLGLGLGFYQVYKATQKEL